jgi:hypothetical protein
MRKIVFTAAAMFAVAAPVFAQNSSDPDKNVADGGVKVAGWTGRTDSPNGNISNAKFVAMGPGYHVTAGPPAIYWNPANVMKVGTTGYTVKASFAQTKAPMHPEAYGLVIAGTDLAGANQNYLYFIVRGDGKFMVKHRYHADVHTLKDWTDSPALKKQDAAGKATNEIAVNVGPEKTTFWANGTEIFSLPSKDMVGGMKLVSLDGIAGIRVNHNLDVHVGGFSATANK